MNYSRSLLLREERIKQKLNYGEQEMLLKEIEDIVNPLYERVTIQLYPELNLEQGISRLSLGEIFIEEKEQEGDESIGEEMVAFYQRMRFGTLK